MRRQPPLPASRAGESLFFPGLIFPEDYRYVIEV